MKRKSKIKLLNSNAIMKGLQHHVHLTILESTSSTNDFLKTVSTKNEIQICIAEQQTEGRGRFKRYWHSPFGENIYFSCRYSFDKKLNELSALPMVVAVTVLKSLEAIGVYQLALKWPNDVLYQQQKISGILVELVKTDNKVAAIIGVGINVNMMSDQDAIHQDWTSVRQILNHDVDRNELIIILIDYLLNNLESFVKTGSEPFVSEWIQHDMMIEKYVTVTSSNIKYQGTVIGIDAHGQLLLRLKNGSIRAFSAGDTSMAKTFQTNLNQNLKSF